METTYDPPSPAWRRYDASINITAKTYDFRVYLADGSNVFEQIGIAANSASDARATKISLGGHNMWDHAGGYWDHIDIYTPESKPPNKCSRPACPSNGICAKDKGYQPQA